MALGRARSVPIRPVRSRPVDGFRADVGDSGRDDQRSPAAHRPGGAASEVGATRRVRRHGADRGRAAATKLVAARPRGDALRQRRLDRHVAVSGPDRPSGRSVRLAGWTTDLPLSDRRRRILLARSGASRVVVRSRPRPSRVRRPRPRPSPRCVRSSITFHGRIDHPSADLAGPPTGRVSWPSPGPGSPQPGSPGTSSPTASPGPMPRSTSERGEALCYVGRHAAPEKGAADALGSPVGPAGPLRVAGRSHPPPPRTPTSRRSSGLRRRVPTWRSWASSTGPKGDQPLPRPRDPHAGAWPEPFGLVAIESLACGTPVVARRDGGLPEIVRDGKDGIVADDSRTLPRRLPEVASSTGGDPRSVLDGSRPRAWSTATR